MVPCTKFLNDLSLVAIGYEADVIAKSEKLHREISGTNGKSFPHFHDAQELLNTRRNKFYPSFVRCLQLLNVLFNNRHALRTANVEQSL